MLPKLLKNNAQAILTILGMTQKGVFVPYRYASGLLADMPVPELEAVFEAAEPGMAEVLAQVDQYSEIIEKFDGAKPPAPRWQQDWFPGLDGAAAYAIVRARRPKRIIEIGSGHSTRFMARAVADGSLPTKMLSIDPAPRADISKLDVQVSCRILGDTELSEIADLEPGDILFIDSSHLALPGSDVDLIFSRLLGRLSPGVLVHIHDILLPDPYPKVWRWRQYGEHLPVAAWLASGGLQPIFSSHWVRTRMASRLAQSCAARIPVRDGAMATSLWTVKMSPSVGSLSPHEDLTGGVVDKHLDSAL